ncbi:SCAN domain-containing protein 3, partial [Stegodyphus mimosarum]
MNFVQLLVHICFEEDERITKEYLFSESVHDTATANEVFKVIDNFISENDISWNKCSDIAQALTQKHSSVISQINKVASETKFTHCCIHREDVLAKTNPENLNQMKIVNFLKS